jgi:hypothetical protein
MRYVGLFRSLRRLLLAYSRATLTQRIAARDHQGKRVEVQVLFLLVSSFLEFLFLVESITVLTVMWSRLLCKDNAKIQKKKRILCIYVHLYTVILSFILDLSNLIHIHTYIYTVILCFILDLSPH